MMSCDKDVDDVQLVFVGDSIAAGWEVSQSFPVRQVANWGNPGSGVEYLESLSGKLVGRDAVVISGTNDSWMFVADPEDYSGRYVEAIIGLEARHVYLFCVFPRAEPYNSNGMNRHIRILNAVVKERVKDLPNFTYIDVFDDLVKGDDLNPNYTYDGLHLTYLGYQVLTAALLEVID